MYKPAIRLTKTPLISRHDSDLMKYAFTYLATAFIITGSTLYAQNKPEECLALHKGTFAFRSNDNIVYTIIRRKKKQVEIEEQTGYYGTYKIRWIGDCTYILYGEKLRRRKGQKPIRQDKSIVYNRISEINGDRHRVQSHIEGAEEFAGDVIIIRIK